MQEAAMKNSVQVSDTTGDAMKNKCLYQKNQMSNLKWIFYSCLLLLVVFASCKRPVFRSVWVQQKAPEKFALLFQTSLGDFEAEFNRSASPLAADRFYAQVKHGYYDHTLFYRIRPGYVAQFGGDDTLRINAWKKTIVPDEPVLQPNVRGAIAYARSGKNSRDNDLFINLGNNSPRLDTINASGVVGYPPFGTVTRGMEVVDSLYSGYGDQVFQRYNLLLKDKKAFLAVYPKLDSILRIRIIRKK